MGSKTQEQTMECYDHATESWFSLSSPRQRRYNHCAVSLDEYIYVIGGIELRKYCDRRSSDFTFVSYQKFIMLISCLDLFRYFSRVFYFFVM